MPSSYTTSLRLTLPATGELSGQWGNTVNTGITELLDAAVAGTATISSWGGAGVSYTLSNNSGTADEARKMFIVATGSPGEAKNVICPAVSKFYVFRNDTTGGYALTLKTPTGTGISVPAGQYRFLYCDGTNVVETFNSVAALTVIGALNAGTIAATTLDLTNLEVTNIKAKDGTASASIADSTGVMSLVANPVLSGGTANGVLYLNGSKVATTGSALTFDGTNLGVGGTSAGPRIQARGTINNEALISSIRTDISVETAIGSDGGLTAGFVRTVTNHPLVFGVNNAEQMRLTSTGLGIGTSSPQAKFEARQDQAGAITRVIVNNNNATSGSGSSFDYYFGTTRLGGLTHAFSTSAYLGFDVWNGSAATERMRLDSSGNLGLGVTPSAWNGGYKAMQIGAESIMFSGTGGNSGFNGWGSNFYIDSAGDTRYLRSSYATIYQQNRNAGVHAWFTAPSGTAGNAITFTQAMTLDASGNLGIGTSSPAYPLQVNGKSYAIQNVNANGSAAAPSYAFGNDEDCGMYRVTTDTIGFSTAGTERLRIDSSGNLGLGVTPSAWGASEYKAAQIGNGASFYGRVASGDQDKAGMSSNAYNNGSNWLYIATDSAARYEQIGGGHYWYTAPSGTAGNAITFTQAMTLDASGRLLIGATSGSSTISGTAAYAELSNNNLASLGLKNTTGLKFEIASLNTGALSFYDSTANAERARITSGGAFYVGFTSGPTAAGNFYSTGTAVVAAIDGNSASADILYAGYSDSTSTALGTLRFQVAANGNVTNSNNSYGAISDVKLKENITDATPKLAGLMQVRIVNYNLKSEPEHKQLGVIAQELEQVFPSMVEETPNRDADGELTGGTTKAVKYSVFVPMLIKAIQEQQALITALTARVAALESN